MFELIASSAARIGSRLRQWREREQAYAELMALDDRSLADIGIRRTDIPFVLATEPARDEGLVFTPRADAPANSNEARRAA